MRLEFEIITRKTYLWNFVFVGISFSTNPICGIFFHTIVGANMSKKGIGNFSTQQNTLWNSKFHKLFHKVECLENLNVSNIN